MKALPSSTGQIPASLSSTVGTLEDGRLESQRLPRTIGVIGLGRMGSAFTKNLLRDGHNVVAFDRDPVQINAVEQIGAKPARHLSNLAGCDIILTSLPDDDALATVVFDGGLPDVMKPDAVHVSMSTVSPSLSRELDAAHDGLGQRYVAAPVLGNPDLAKSRRLFILASGQPAAIARVRPVLERLGEAAVRDWR